MAETMELVTRRAVLTPDTADPEARTVEVIWSTGAPVRRRDLTGGYVERLSLDPAAVDLSRLEGASVLDAHRQAAVRDVLGTVRSAAVDGHRGTAVIQFSARPEVAPIWQDVLAGILRHVSVGYSVEEWSETTENGMRVLTAVRWTPHEISVVPTPADPGARIRMETQLTETNQAALDTPAAHGAAITPSGHPARRAPSEAPLVGRSTGRRRGGAGGRCTMLTRGGSTRTGRGTRKWSRSTWNGVCPTFRGCGRCPCRRRPRPPRPPRPAPTRCGR